MLKKYLLTSFSCLMLVFLFGCGNKTKQVETFGETFASYVNNNEADSVKAVYPEINFEAYSQLPTDSISVEKIDDDIYRVNYGQSKWIEVEVGDNGLMTVVDSKGVADFPQEKLEIALKTGMLSETISDVKASELMNDSTYFIWLNKNMKQPIGLVKGKIRKQPGYDYYGRPCECSTERMTCTVTNNTEKPISGNDYAITYAYSYATCSDGSSPDVHTTGKTKGVDLAPGESKDINIAINDYGLKNVELKYNVPKEKLYNGLNPYTGNEYSEYLKQKSDMENANFDWLSERVVSPKDLENKSQDELRIMRNWIFARHGYIFKSKDLQDYFAQFPWYEPRSTNVNSQFNKIEKENIEIIKSYE